MMFDTLVGPSVYCALGLLASRRARQLGDVSPLSKRSPEAFGLGFIVMVALSGLHTTALEQVGFALAAICAWSDVTNRRVYLPVIIGASIAALSLTMVTGTIVDTVGLFVIGGAALALHLIAGENHFAFGDVLLFGVLGYCFGPWVAGESIAIGLVVGAFVAVTLVSTHVCARRYEWPLASFIALGIAGEFIVRGGA